MYSARSPGDFLLAFPANRGSSICQGFVPFRKIYGPLFDTDRGGSAPHFILTILGPLLPTGWKEYRKL
jgi:hypothetical protein